MLFEIKTNKNSFEVSDQDSTDGVQYITYNAREMVKSWRSIGDPTATT